MFYVYLFLAMMFGTILGLSVMAIFSAKRNNPTYQGAIVVIESETGLVYRLELAGDPELLMYQKEVRLLVVPPDYDKLLSQ